jgi:hypothetical protein
MFSYHRSFINDNLIQTPLPLISQLPIHQALAFFAEIHSRFPAAASHPLGWFILDLPDVPLLVDYYGWSDPYPGVF